MKSRLAANRARASSLGLLAGRSGVGNKEHPQIDEAEPRHALDRVEHDTQPDLRSSNAGAVQHDNKQGAPCAKSVVFLQTSSHARF